MSQDEYPPISEDSIADYLYQHPDFFTRHQQLVMELEIPHLRGQAVSLVERQVQVLREENQHLEHKLTQLIDNAKRNEELNQRIQRIIISLAAVDSVDAFFNTLYEVMLKEFHTDDVVLRLFEVPHSTLSGRKEFVEYDAQVFTLFEPLLNQGTPLCGQLNAAQMTYLFPEQDIKSAVVLPIGIPKPQGVLALGSEELTRFHAGMGTELLKYMSDVISHLLAPWLRVENAM